MTKAEQLRALADRCEAASGPDRELDCLIWGTLDGRSLEWQGNLLVEKTEGPIGWIDPGEHQRNFCCNRADQGFNGIRAYTASIDAAMTLVPESHNVGFSWRKATEPTLRANAQLWTAQERSTINGDSRTPALALCAAALRALAEKEEK